MSANLIADRPAATAAQATGASATPVRRWLQAAMLPTASVVATLLLLELLTRTGIISRSVFPPPSAIIVEMVLAVVQGPALLLTFSTLQGWAVGLAAGVLVGVVLGLLLGSIPILEALLSGVLEFVRPIPSVALIPLFVIMLGIGMETKYVLVFIGSLWPILIHTVLGTREVDRLANDSCRTYGVPTLGRIWHVTLPSIAPQFMTGLRVSSAIALIVAITVELIVGARGLGQQVNIAQQAGNNTQMWAYIALIGLLGVLINAVFLSIERRTLNWHSSQRMESA